MALRRNLILRRREAPSRRTQSADPACCASLAEWQGVAHAPPIDADEQEQPDHVDEVPVPGRRLQPEMMVRLEMALRRAPQADREKDRPDDDVEAMEPGRHEECRGVDPVGEVESGMAVFVSLDRGERDAEKNRHRKALDQALLIAFQ